MSYVATAAIVGTVAGGASSIMGGQHAKKMAKKQAALAKKEAKRIREQGQLAAAAMTRELEAVRTLRDLDLPAFQQAQKQSFLNASRASERVARTRTMGQLGDGVREAMFGGQFDQYIGRKTESFTRHANLTQQLFEGTSRIQQLRLDAESRAGQLSYGGQSAAISAEAAAGDMGAKALGAAAQALGQFASAKGAEAKDQKSKKDDEEKPLPKIKVL